MQSSNGKCLALVTLKEDHDELRAGLAKATTGYGEVGEAAERVARLCVAHFELEEQTVFPLFAAADDLIEKTLLTQMDEILEMITRFKEHVDDLEEQHDSMNSAVEALWLVAGDDGNEEIISLLRSLKSHEMMEEEVLCPPVRLITEHLQHKLPGGSNSSQSIKNSLFT